MPTGPGPSARLFYWYSSGQTCSDTHEPAQAAFQDGLKIFKDHLTKDPDKKRLADQLLASTLEDVVKAVTDAVGHYQEQRGSTTIRDGLAAFSKRLLYYGNVVDVLVQHHPEYVALVWGAMKLLFGAVMEHERTGTTIVTALSDIADVLPRVELTLHIYPAAPMQQTVSMLCAHIVRFLVRAWRYYDESRLSRAVHSITRPAALRYDDIIKMIQKDAQLVASHAATASQAELRDMHHEIRRIQSQLDHETTRDGADGLVLHAKIDALAESVTLLQQTMVLEKAVSATAQIHIRTTLSDMQLTQALAMISSQCRIDHKSVLQSHSQLHSRRRLTGIFNRSGAPVWTSTQLKEWNKSPTSSAMLLKSTFHERSQIRGFCAEVINQLVTSQTAVLWVLVGKGETYPLVEVLKSLVLQALTLDSWTHSETKMSFHFRSFLAAHFEDDYVKVLGDILQHFRLVYIIASAEAMSPATALQCRDSLRQLSRALSERGSQTTLKIITTAHGPGSQSQDSSEDFVVTVGRMSRRRAKKHMKDRTRKREVMLRRQPPPTVGSSNEPYE